MVVEDNKVFLMGELASDDYFIDREDDAKRLSANLSSGINTILLSPRRWGKSSLVAKVAASLNRKPNIKVVVIDTFLCKNEQDFFNTFSSELIKQTSGSFRHWVEDAKRFLSNVMLKVTYGPDVTNEFGLSLDFSDKNLLSKEVLQLPQRIAEQKGYSLVVCIDEFQSVAEYSQTVEFQRVLRSYWQKQKNVTYCLFGSKKHLLEGMFIDQSMPFYKFGDMIYLPKIDSTHWVRYITGRFKRNGKSISPDIALKLCNTVDCHSQYVQQLAWITYVNTDKETTEDILEKSVMNLINQNSALCYKIASDLTQYRVNFLKALCRGVKSGFTSQEVIRKYDLGTASNIKRIVDALEDKEVIDIADDGSITFNDPVFRLWLVKKYGF